MLDVVLMWCRAQRADRALHQATNWQAADTEAGEKLLPPPIIVVLRRWQLQLGSQHEVLLVVACVVKFSLQWATVCQKARACVKLY